MLLVLEGKPCQEEEHEEEKYLDAKVLPLGDAMLWQAVVLQELQCIHYLTVGLSTSMPVPTCAPTIRADCLVLK